MTDTFSIVIKNVDNLNDIIHLTKSVQSKYSNIENRVDLFYLKDLNNCVLIYPYDAYTMDTCIIEYISGYLKALNDTKYQSLFISKQYVLEHSIKETKDFFSMLGYIETTL
jgi:hypothetical protein